MPEPSSLTEMDEFAISGSGYSSLGGQTLNPYQLNRQSGGSSGGTGAAIAANFATVGTGSDTGGSIRERVCGVAQITRKTRVLQRHFRVLSPSGQLVACSA